MGIWISRHGLLFVAVALSASACARQGNVTVTGKVVRNGQPIPLSPSGSLDVTLMPDVPAEQEYTTYPGYCDKDGNFTIQDVPPGKYKIGIQQFDPNPQTDKLSGAFRAENAKFTREIDGTTPLLIDLGKPGS